VDRGVVRHDSEYQFFDSIVTGHSDERPQQDRAQSVPLEVVQNCDSYLGGIRVRGSDVASNTRTFSVDRGSPSDVGSLVDIRQIVEFVCTQTPNAHTETGIPTLHRQLAETLLYPMPIFPAQRAEKRLSPVRKWDGHPGAFRW